MKRLWEIVMSINFSEFYLLRPELLWLLIPTVVALYGVRHLAKKQSSWHKVISPHLLKFLIVSGEKQKSYVSFWLTGIIALLIIVAISGPSFRQQSVPVFQAESARVILLDLSLSMDATDIKPARIDRAKHKIMDLLGKNKEGSIGLVVYAGDAFIISPLTSDANTIASMVPTLSTGIMPVLGSRPDIAINTAISLLNNAKQTRGQIIWITDGIEEEYIDSIKQSINNKKHLLSILAIGTAQGAPIPLPDKSGFLKDPGGNIILPKLESSNLKDITLDTNGQYVELSANSDDIDFILSTLTMDADEDSSESDERISRWIDDGYWLSWFVLTFMFIKLFRRTDSTLMNHSGIIFALVFFSMISPEDARANILDDLWSTRDQQASKAFKKKNYDKAAELFENEQWQAASSYKKNDFESAIQQYSKSNDIESIYNKANSLAKSQQLQQAIDSYNQVLEQAPSHEDALFNKKIVEDLLKQQQQEQQNKDQEKQDQENKDKQESDENPESDSEKNSEQNSEEQSEEEKNAEKQEQEQQSKEESEKQVEEKEAQLSEDQRDQNEKDQALENWLEKIPDDPGGLLRRKMYREYQRRGRQQKEKKIW